MTDDIKETMHTIAIRWRRKGDDLSARMAGNSPETCARISAVVRTLYECSDQIADAIRTNSGDPPIGRGRRCHYR